MGGRAAAGQRGLPSCPLVRPLLASLFTPARAASPQTIVQPPFESPLFHFPVPVFPPCLHLVFKLFNNNLLINAGAWAAAEIAAAHTPGHRTLYIIYRSVSGGMGSGIFVSRSY